MLSPERKAELLDLGELLHGIPHFVVCGTCNGSGIVPDHDPMCDGTCKLGCPVPTDCPDCVEGLVGQHGWELEWLCRRIEGGRCLPGTADRAVIREAWYDKLHSRCGWAAVFVLVERGPIGEPE